MYNKKNKQKKTKTLTKKQKGSSGTRGNTSVENGLLRIGEVVMQDRDLRRVFGEQPGLFDV